MKIFSRFTLLTAASALALAACGSSEEAAEPIVFSSAQSTLSSRTAGAAEAAADAAMPNSKMAGLALYAVEY
jgi:hypothetical protein